MNAADMKARTNAMAKRVIKLIQSLPNDRTANVIANQMLRSATSVGANYRAACRGRSRADFIAKPGIVEEESDETAYWLELLMETNIKPVALRQPLYDEVNEITAIIVASRKTAKA